MSKKTDALDDIIYNTEEAARHLKDAKEAAESVGDKSGAGKISKEIDDVENINKEFKNIKDRKSS